MENATKALLIAAAVLIAIVLIGISIRVLASTRGVTDEVGVLTDTMSASIFNSQFTKYKGQQKGREVKSLLRLAKQTNLRLEVGEITLWITNGEGSPTQYTIDTLLDSLVNNDIYPVDFNYDDNTGLVNKIIVTIH